MYPFKLALNTSTLRPFQLNVIEQIRVAQKAKYQGIELWVSDIETYLESGGTTREIKQHLEESGISLVNAIAFFKWTDIDENVRKQGFEQAKREMNMLMEIGCEAVAAPPFGDVAGVSLEKVAENFSELAQLASKIGINPYLEFWGRAKQLSRVSQAMYVAIESGVPNAKILIDPFHMYTGGSRIEDLFYINGERIGIVHVNDYPAVPTQDVIVDQDRVFPGDGIAPSAQLAEILHKSGYQGYLSLELFMQSFGQQTPIEVARHGLEKIKRAYNL